MPVKKAQVEWEDGQPTRIQRAVPGDGFVLCPDCRGWAWMAHFGGQVPCEAAQCAGGLIPEGKLQ